MDAEIVRWKKRVADFWDELASKWSQVEAREEVNLPARLDCQAGDLILDAGCGTGRWSIYLAERGYSIRGFDLSFQMVKKAKNKSKELGLDEKTVNYLIGDTEQIAFPDNSFDGIVCINVLDFVPRPGKTLAEFKRVLKPGQRLVLEMMGAYSPINREVWRRFLPENEDLPRTTNGILPWETEKLLIELGWQIIDQYGNFAPSGGGVNNFYTQESADQFQDTVLKQTIATSWGFVAVSPSSSINQGFKT